MSSTIKQAIESLRARLASAYTAVADKGGTLPATQNSANLPAAIDSIPSGLLSTGIVSPTYPNNKVETILQLLCCPNVEYKIFDEIDDNNITIIKRSNPFYGIGTSQYHQPSKVTMRALKSINANNVLFDNRNATILDFPELETIIGSSVISSDIAIYLTRINFPKLKKISGDNVLKSIGNGGTLSFPELLSVSGNNSLSVVAITLDLPKLTTLSGSDVMRGISVRNFEMPNLQTFSSLYFPRQMDMPKARRYNVLNCPGIGFASTQSGIAGCVNLIDYVCGAAWTGSHDIRQWNPTNALDSSQSALITDAEDEFGNAITNNLQQLLYNIRRHLAANLDQSITGKTITFSSAVYNAIHADSTTESAFGVWSIASA